MPAKSPLDMMSSPEAARRAAAPPRRRLVPILAPAAIIVVLGLAWFGLWSYGASIAERTLDGWVAREAAAGRYYSCGSQSTGGFPARIEVRCSDVAAEVRTLQPPYVLKAQSLAFAAEIWHPTELAGNVTGPLAFTLADRPPLLIANWTRATLTLRGIPPDPDKVAVQLDNAYVETGGTHDTIVRAKSGDLQGSVVEGSAHDHPVIAITLRLDGASAPTFHPLFAEPLAADFDATIRGLSDLSPKPWADRFREIHAANGGIEVKSLRMTQGKIVVAGTGSLNINGRGRLEGLLRVSIVGIDDLVPRLGIDRLISQSIDQLAGSEGATARGAAALDRLIPGLGGAIRDSANSAVIENLKKMGQRSTIDNQPAIVLPLRVTDGAIYLGMLGVGEIPPLF